MNNAALTLLELSSGQLFFLVSLRESTVDVECTREERVRRIYSVEEEEEEEGGARGNFLQLWR